MKSKILPLALGVFLAAAPAMAQNPFDQLKKLGGSVASGNGTVATNIYTSFLAARLEMNAAQLELAQAFDLKDQITLLEAEQVRLQSGAIDGDGIKKSTVLSNSVSEAINDRIAQKVTLSAEGKKHYQASLPHLLVGTVATVGLVKGAKDALTAGSLTDKFSLGMIAKDMPGLAKATYEDYKMVITYGKDNNIPMPANASDALGTLGG